MGFLLNVILSVGLFAATPTMPTQAGAQYLTGNALLRYCEMDREAATYHQSYAMCIGFVMGAYDTLVTSGDLMTAVSRADKPFRLTCVPDTVEAGQLVAVVVKFMEDRPADRNKAASLIVFSALLDAYPCQPT